MRHCTGLFIDFHLHLFATVNDVETRILAAFRLSYSFTIIFLVRNDCEKVEIHTDVKLVTVAWMHIVYVTGMSLTLTTYQALSKQRQPNDCRCDTLYDS